MAFQLSAATLGEFDSHSTFENYESSYTALSFTVNGTLPLSESGFALFIRGGTGTVSLSEKLKFSDGDSYTISDSGGAFVTGLGASYTYPKFTKLTYFVAMDNYAYRVSNWSGDSVTNNLTSLNAGVRFNF